MDTPAPPNPDNWRVWLIGVSFATLVWNAANSYFNWRLHKNSQETDRRHKELAVHLEEFRSSIKAPISNALSDITPIGMTAEAISKTTLPIEENTPEIEQANKDFAESFGALERALKRANDCRFSVSIDWTDTVFESQDLISDAFNNALDAQQPVANRLSFLSTIASEIERLESALVQRIDEEIERFAKGPSKPLPSKPGNTDS